MKKLNPDLLRNVIFGVEDSIVSILGVLFGITAISSFTQEQICVTGLVTIIVEATSMGAGSFLSESSAMELDKNKNYNPIFDGFIMFQ